MVYQVKAHKYRPLLEALILTILIFLIGFEIGFFIEYSRGKGLADKYNEYEVQALDLKLQNYYFQIMDKASCDEALNQNFIFADKLYNSGLKIEKYEEANQLSSDLSLDKKRYVLLKTELWLNTVLLRNKCNKSIDTIVYFYSSDSNDVTKTAQQKIISNVLKGVKEKEGNKVVLIPIAGDLDLDAVTMQMRVYNVTSLPSILINEKTLLEGYQSEEAILARLS